MGAKYFMNTLYILRQRKAEDSCTSCAMQSTPATWVMRMQVASAAIQHMMDGFHIAIKLDQQRKPFRFSEIGFLHQHTLGIQFLPQDLRAEPFGNQRHFQIAAVAVIGAGVEIHDAVCMERRGITFGVQTQADSAGDGFGRFIRKRSHTIFDRFGQLGNMDVFQIVFDFFAHCGQQGLWKPALIMLNYPSNAKLILPKEDSAILSG